MSIQVRSNVYTEKYITHVFRYKNIKFFIKFTIRILIQPPFNPHKPYIPYFSIFYTHTCRKLK